MICYIITRLKESGKFFMPIYHFVLKYIINEPIIMRMETLKMLLTIGAILIVPIILMPQFFIGLLILIVACIAFRQRNF